jgi:hypothetical protein
MSANRQQPHVLVLPEDDANRQIANGFLQDQALFHRRIQVLVPAGGWTKVLSKLQSDYLGGMELYPARFMVLLIDFDGSEDRLTEVRQGIPSHLADRVFVLGARTEPEDLKRANLGSYETIGGALARECREGTNRVWGHHLLCHNESEITRLRERVRPFLFQYAE